MSCNGCIDSINHPHAFDCEREPNVICGDCGYTCAITEDFYSPEHKAQCG